VPAKEKEMITDKDQAQVQLARGDGRYQQLLELREMQYFEDNFLTFSCYRVPGQVDRLALPKEG
jgi:hypothetical protein